MQTLTNMRLHSTFKNSMVNMKASLLSNNKEMLYGTPPKTKNNKIIKGTGTLPDMQRLDRILSL